IGDADAIIGGITKEDFPAAKKLKWVQAISAGVEAYSFWPEFVKSDVQLTNCKVVQGPTIADHAFAMLLALTRGLNEYIPNRTKRQWGNRTNAPENMTELPGMTAVIVGAGGIGTQIAQRAHGFGMKVIGVDPRDMPVSNFFSEIVPPDRLDGRPHRQILRPTDHNIPRWRRPASYAGSRDRPVGLGSPWTHSLWNLLEKSSRPAKFPQLPSALAGACIERLLNGDERDAATSKSRQEAAKIEYVARQSAEVRDDHDTDRAGVEEPEELREARALEVV